MSSARVLAVRAAVFGIVVALGGGCFRPKIGPALNCDLTKGAKACPDNFKCDTATDLCVPANSTDGGTDAAKGGSGGVGGHAGVGGSGGVAGKGGTGGGGGTGNVDAHPDVPCLPAVVNPNCPERRDGGMCDPVCNVGCGDCHDRCSISSTGALTCNPRYVNGTNPGVQQVCAQNETGINQQDNCAPGQVCMTDMCGSRCKQFCRMASDCTTPATTAACSRDAGGGFLVCDVPYATCDPVTGVASTMNSGCVQSIQGCYISPTTGSTICDCSFSSLPEFQSCTHSRDCIAGLVCFDPTGGRNGPTCTRVCRLPVDGGGGHPGELACPGAGSVCTAFPGVTSPFGYCN